MTDSFQAIDEITTGVVEYLKLVERHELKKNGAAAHFRSVRSMIELIQGHMDCARSEHDELKRAARQGH